MRNVMWSTLLLTMGCAGCQRQSGPKTVGADLPVTSSRSVALPGATDAADAPRSPSVAESQDATLTTYRDPATGVSFQYPTVWRPAAGQVLPSPAFSQTAGAPRISQGFTPEGTAYAPTVLRALTFSYTVKKGSDAAACEGLPEKALAGAKGQTQVQFGGVPFTEAAGGDAAMCTQVRSQIDSTLQGSQCLVFERDFVTSCPYTKTSTLPRPLTTQEEAALQRHLDAVMASVRLAPR